MQNIDSNDEGGSSPEDGQYLPDGSVEALSRNLNTGQLAIVYAMLKHNEIHGTDPGMPAFGNPAVYRQRQQLIWRQMVEIDELMEGVAGENVLKMRLRDAIEFVERHEELQ